MTFIDRDGQPAEMGHRTEDPVTGEAVVAPTIVRITGEDVQAVLRRQKQTVKPSESQVPQRTPRS